MKAIFIITVLLLVSCSKNEPGANTKNSTDSTQNKSHVRKFDLSEGQKKVLDGAIKCLEAKFDYDITMGYYILTYKDGVNTGSKVFPGGDMDPGFGVCTEVIIRALRWGGVCDLQEEIYNDIKSNFIDYPMSRWSAKKPDPNIDQRRVPVQMVWFSKYWQELSIDNDFQPGDVVAWDMNGDGWGDHIGIVSDKYGPDETLMLIHNFPSPGYVAEEDVLNRWKIIGHYRITE
jgi:uncharacterized protein YijF (DUF1287 family)